MPPRLVSLAILIYWSIAAFCLFTWDLLPELSLGYPPDFRAIAAAGDSGRPARWSIQVIDDPKSPEIRRAIGEAVTTSRRLPDGWFELSSQVDFDSAGLLQGTPLAAQGSFPLRIHSIYRVDPSGNLRNFDMRVSVAETAERLFTVAGRLKGQTMEVEAKGPISMLNQKLSFPYEPRSVVHDALGPLDRLPGLSVGQRWETRAVNPFSGQVERVRVEVARRTLIHWGGETVSAFEVVQNAGPIAARTWVRNDGVILRQEVPFPIVRLVLDRLTDDAPPAFEGGGP